MSRTLLTVSLASGNWPMSVRIACEKHATHIEATDATLAPLVIDVLTVTGTTKRHQRSGFWAHVVGLFARQPHPFRRRIRDQFSPGGGGSLATC
jgi:hypothetical protein